MKKYTLNPIKDKDIIYFTITCGLMPGYQKTEPHTLETVLHIYQTWIQNRLERDLPVFAATISPTNLIYGFNDLGSIINNNEKGFIIKGEIIRTYCPDIFDNHEVLLGILVNLAETIGAQTGQERIHLSYNKQKYILE